MKKTSFPHKSILSTIIPLCLAQSAMSAITVHFVEEGPDLRVSFSGTLDLTGAPGTTVSSAMQSGSALIGSAGVFTGGTGYSQSLGAATLSGIATISAGVSNPSMLGFSGNFLYWDDGHLSGGSTVGNVTELTANSTVDTFVIAGASLASVNAEPIDISEGATLWTSNGDARDTFIFSRVAPVPEPSTGILGGLALLGLLRRRR